MAAVFPRVISQQVQAVRGEVAVVDRTGQVAAALRQVLTPEAISARRLEGAKRALENTPAVVRDAAGNATVMQRTIGTPPALTILERPAGSDLQREKQWLVEPPSPDGLRHLALIVIQPDAIVPADGRIEYGGYELFVPENLDERIETELYDGLRESLVAARMEARNLDRRPGGSHHAGQARHLGDRGGRHGAAYERGLQPHAALRVRRAPGVRCPDRRPDAADADRRGEVQPRRRGPALGGVADRTDGGEDPGPDGREHAGPRAVRRHGTAACWCRLR